MSLEDRVKVLEEKIDSLEARLSQRPEVAPTNFWAHDYLQKNGPETGAVVFAGNINVPTVGPYGWQWELSTVHMLRQPWGEISTALAALAHPVRLELLRAILNGKNTSQDLQNMEGLGTTGQLYHHLKELQATGWLKLESRGVYRVPGEKVIPLLAVLLAAGGEQLAEGA